jgi:hypothetical protein
MTAPLVVLVVLIRLLGAGAFTRASPLSGAENA